MKKWLIPVLLILALASVFALRTHRISKGVMAVHLVAGCKVEIYDTTVQPFTTVVLACPRMDAIRFWPWPVEQPWYEDWWEKPPIENHNLETATVKNWQKKLYLNDLREHMLF